MVLKYSPSNIYFSYFTLLFTRSEYRFIFIRSNSSLSIIIIYVFSFLITTPDLTYIFYNHNSIIFFLITLFPIWGTLLFYLKNLHIVLLYFILDLTSANFLFPGTAKYVCNLTVPDEPFVLYSSVWIYFPISLKSHDFVSISLVEAPLAMNLMKSE